MNDRNRGRRRGRPALLALLALGLAAPALAVDGVIEINQAKALAGSVSAGDFPGFPVSLTEPGSYRLTSDLNVGAGLNGINVDADDVSLDLNGFSVIGNLGSVADGISLAGRKNVEIRNGTIRGFSRSGIFTNINSFFIRVLGVRASNNVTSGIELQGSGNLIDGCTATGNGTGLRALDGSLVINSVSRQNSGLGLSLSATTGYRSNVLTGNNGGNSFAQITGGGIQLGQNICGNSLCP